VDATTHPTEARKKMGFLSGTTGLYRRLTVRENIAYFARLHGVPDDVLDERIDALFSQLDMHDFADKRAEDLSTGMKQKTSIARAVIHDPDVIVFDEPTTGLDVLAAKTVLEFIEAYKQMGKAVIFSTHHLHEVEKLCDRVALINYGESQFDGSLEDFRALSPEGDLYEAFLSRIAPMEGRS
jgi:sodium transport system ATP-binding protein